MLSYSKYFNTRPLTEAEIEIAANQPVKATVLTYKYVPSWISFTIEIRLPDNREATWVFHGYEEIMKFFSASGLDKTAELPGSLVLVKINRKKNTIKWVRGIKWVPNERQERSEKVEEDEISMP